MPVPLESHLWAYSSGCAQQSPARVWSDLSAGMRPRPTKPLGSHLNVPYCIRFSFQSSPKAWRAGCPPPPRPSSLLLCVQGSTFSPIPTQTRNNILDFCASEADNPIPSCPWPRFFSGDPALTTPPLLSCKGSNILVQPPVSGHLPRQPPVAPQSHLQTKGLA